MAIAYAGATPYTLSDSQNIHTFSHTVSAGSDRVLLVAVQCWGSEFVVAVTYGGVRLSRLGREVPGSTSKPTCELWGMVAPPVGAADVIITLSGAGSNYLCAAALDYTGVDQLGPVGAAASANAASGTTCSCNLTTLAANSWIVGAKGGYGGDTYPHAPGAGVTERVDVQSGTNATADGGFCAGDLAAGAAGAYTWSVTQNASDDWAVVVVELMEAGSGIPDTRRVTQVLLEADVEQTTAPLRVTQVLAEVDLGIRVPLRVTQVLLEVDVEPPEEVEVVPAITPGRFEVILRDTAGRKLGWWTGWEELFVRRQVNALGGFALQLGGGYVDMISYLGLWPLDGIVEVWRENQREGIAKYLEFEGLFRDPRVWRDDVGAWHFLAVGPGFLDLLARTQVQATAGSAEAVKSGPAETVLKAYVDEQLGPGAGARARSDVTIEADGGRGNTITVNGFNKNLLALAQEVAKVGGGDFDLVGTGGGGMEFRWYDVCRGTDRRSEVLFSSEYGNLDLPDYAVRNSTVVNSVLVMGQGEGAARARELVEDAGSIAESKWNRVEVNRDARDVATSAELIQRGEVELDRNRRSVALGFRVRQTGGRLYGRDYFLGDLVRARPLQRVIDRKIDAVEIRVRARTPEEIAVETIDV